MDRDSLPRRLEREVEEAARGVPRWPATVAVLAIGALYLVISDRLTLGPSWLVLVAGLVLSGSLWAVRLRGYQRATHLLARAIAGGLTVVIVASAALLVVQLTRSQTAALPLLRDAALIWVANIATFALWYWEIDGGGPALRHPAHHASGDFAFPQMQQDDNGVARGWSPGFLDYFFLAFNTSTAFSPTDTLVLSRRAKVLMMIQSSISLVVIAVLAARAINTLN